MSTVPKFHFRKVELICFSKLKNEQFEYINRTRNDDKLRSIFGQLIQNNGLLQYFLSCYYVCLLGLKETLKNKT